MGLYMGYQRNYVVGYMSTNEVLDFMNMIAMM